MAERFLLLVRHGHYFSDPAHGRAGHLSPLGRKQTRRLARRLAEYPIAELHTSSAPRAVETAEILAAELSLRPRTSALLLEGIPTRIAGVEGLERARIERDRARMERAFARHFRPTRGADRYEVLVCHGNIIRYLLRRALDDAPQKWWRSDICHCGLSMVSVGSGLGNRLLALNDVGHLPRALQTFL